MRNVLKLHIEVCPKHPLNSANKRIAELEAALEYYGTHEDECTCSGDSSATGEQVIHAAVCANCDCGLAAALFTPGEHEHPDTARLDKLGRWLKYPDGSVYRTRFLLDLLEHSIDVCGDGFTAEDSELLATDLRSAIDALPGEEVDRG